MQERENILKIAKKADVWAKSELRFTAGSQGQAKKTSVGTNYPASHSKDQTQTNKCTNAKAYKHMHAHTHRCIHKET